MPEEFVQEENMLSDSKDDEMIAKNTEEEKTEIPKQSEPEEESPGSKNGRLKSVMEYFQFGPDEDFSRDDYILARVRDEDLMEYLRMDQERERERRAAKELRERRLFRTFQLLVILITVAVVVGLLKDSPLVLVNILYIFGILLAVWIWKNPKDPKDPSNNK